MERKKLEDLITDLKVDIDYKPLDLDKLAWRMETVCEVLEVELESIRIMETGKGYHIHGVILGDVDDKDVIIIQMALGSDYLRELYNLRRVRNGIKNWNVLFSSKYKEENGKLVKVSEEKLALGLTMMLCMKRWKIRGEGLVRKYLAKLREVIGKFV